AIGRGPQRRAETVEDGRDAPPRPRTADHRQDATLEPRGVPAHPGRSRDHRPRRIQRPHPHAAGRLPRDQDPQPVRRHKLVDPEATFDYLASLEWIRAAENTTPIGPAGTGKSHALVA